MHSGVGGSSYVSDELSNVEVYVADSNAGGSTGAAGSAVVFRGYGSNAGSSSAEHISQQDPLGLSVPPLQTATQHEQTLAMMKKQFVIMERAFLTLEGLCRSEISAIEAAEKRMENARALAANRFREYHQLTGAGEIVKLNVGGSRFQVSASTLLKYPGSLFDVLLGTQFPVQRDEYGYIFIDRDPELFRELLHYLRSGDSSTIRMLPPITRRRVIDEASYFAMDQLLMELRSTRHQWFCESVCRSIVTGEIPAPRCFAAAQYVGAGVVLMFGGCTANDVFFDTLYKIHILPNEAGACSAGHHASPDSVMVYDSVVYGGAAGGTTAAQQLYGTAVVPPISSSSIGASTEDQLHTMSLIGVEQQELQPRPERFVFSLVRPVSDSFVPPARSGHAMVFLQGHLLLLYGNDKSGHVHEVFAYNTFTNLWSMLSCVGDYVEPRSGHSVTVMPDGHLWLIGGKQIFPVMKNFGDIFEGTVDFERECILWRSVTPRLVIPEGAIVEERGYHSAAAYGDCIVIHGGIVRNVYCSDLCLYDVVQNVWRCLQPGEPPTYTPSNPRSGHIAVVNGDEMLVFGSYSEDHPSMLLSSLCLKTFVWRRVPVTGRSPARRAAPSGVLLPQDAAGTLLPRLLVFGGFDITTRKCFNDLFTITL